MTTEIMLVLLALIGMLAALIWDKMRPGMVLLTVVVFLPCIATLSPKHLL